METKPKKQEKKITNWVPRLLCSKHKNPFFLIAISAASLQELSVLMVLLSKTSGTTQQRKNRQKLELKFLHIE